MTRKSRSTRGSRRTMATAALVVGLAGWSATDGLTGRMFEVSTCEELIALPTPMNDDTHVVVEGDISCIMTRTVRIAGPHAYLLSSRNASVTFENIRFHVKDEADFFVALATEEFQGMATFAGLHRQDRMNPQFSKYSGGSFNVEKGASATFGVPVIFRDNFVWPKKRGGAIFNQGHVTFEYSAKFEQNSVKSNDRSGSKDTLDSSEQFAGCGGAIYNGPGAIATFADVSWFSDNTAGTGSGGGAICNDGVVDFWSRSYFTGNVAPAIAVSEVDAGGVGGAVYTGEGAETIFRNKATFRKNTGGLAGGAVHTAGVTRLQRGATFNGNHAASESMGRGGHVYASGVFQVTGDTMFTRGKATRDGGALFISSTGDATFEGGLTFVKNQADNECHDVFDAKNSVICQTVPW